MGLLNLIDRLRCSHEWKEISRWNIIQYPGPCSAAFNISGYIVGTKTRYRCDKCKSEKTIKGA